MSAGSLVMTNSRNASATVPSMSPHPHVRPFRTAARWAAADDRVRMYGIHHGQALLQDRAGFRQPALMLEEQTEGDAGPPDRIVVGAPARLAHRLGQPLLGGFRPVTTSVLSTVDVPMIGECERFAAGEGLNTSSDVTAPLVSAVDLGAR